MNACYFGDQLRILAALEDGRATEQVLAAFKSVAREDFAGPGPWKVRSALADVSLPLRQTPDADPRWLYHSVLVVLDEEKGINIGDPSLWAGLLARADVQPGARVLQIGAGVGYYTAILSKLVGPTGRVTAFEVEEALAAQAATNLTKYENVDVHHGNAAIDVTGTDAFDFVIAFAGVTHIPAIWASRLAPGARLLLPLTGDDWWGAMILAETSAEGFSAITLGRCGFYPCTGARRDDLSAQITNLFSQPERRLNCDLRIIGSGNEVHFALGTP